MTYVLTTLWDGGNEQGGDRGPQVPCRQTIAAMTIFELPGLTYVRPGLTYPDILSICNKPNVGDNKTNRYTFVSIYIFVATWPPFARFKHLFSHCQIRFRAAFRPASLAYSLPPSSPRHTLWSSRMHAQHTFPKNPLALPGLAPTTSSLDLWHCLHIFSILILHVKKYIIS